MICKHIEDHQVSPRGLCKLFQKVLISKKVKKSQVKISIIRILKVTFVLKTLQVIKQELCFLL